MDRYVNGLMEPSIILGAELVENACSPTAELSMSCSQAEYGPIICTRQSKGMNRRPMR
jgi:hypothetical protein